MRVGPGLEEAGCPGGVLAGRGPFSGAFSESCLEGAEGVRPGLWAGSSSPRLGGRRALQLAQWPPVLVLRHSWEAGDLPFASRLVSSSAWRTLAMAAFWEMA